jgi:hypothetical protein
MNKEASVPTPSVVARTCARCGHPELVDGVRTEVNADGTGPITLWVTLKRNARGVLRNQVVQRVLGSVCPKCGAVDLRVTEPAAFKAAATSDDVRSGILHAIGESLQRTL